MENFCFSIDEERYDDRHGHVLSLDGWYAHPERKVYEFELLGDGYDTVELPQIQRRERPDVAQADRKSTRLNSSHNRESRMPSSA